MTDTIRQTAVDRALRMLDAAGAIYAVQFDGNTYGALEVKPPPKYNRIYKRGETRAYYVPHLEHMQPGDSAAVPFGPFDKETLARNIAAYCVHEWGAGAAMTHRNDDADVVEVLRLF